VPHCCTWETLKFQAECRTSVPCVVSSVVHFERTPSRLKLMLQACTAVDWTVHVACRIASSAFNIAVLVSWNTSLAKPRTWVVKAKDFCSRPRRWPSRPRPWPSRPRTQNLSSRTCQGQGPRPRTTTLLFNSNNFYQTTLMISLIIVLKDSSTQIFLSIGLCLQYCWHYKA